MRQHVDRVGATSMMRRWPEQMSVSQPKQDIQDLRLLRYLLLGQLRRTEEIEDCMPRSRVTVLPFSNAATTGYAHDQDCSIAQL